MVRVGDVRADRWLRARGGRVTAPDRQTGVCASCGSRDVLRLCDELEGRGNASMSLPVIRALLAGPGLAGNEPVLPRHNDPGTIERVAGVLRTATAGPAGNPYMVTALILDELDRTLCGPSCSRPGCAALP